MCGISGFVDFSGKSDRNILERMTRTIEHRGPDGEGYALFNGVASTGLGHRRLSIIDLTEGGKQPMQFGHLHITFNGEVYNYAEIRKELEESGDTFLSHSDTEVILHAFAKWGAKALHRFTGMFAFVIYDDLNKKLFACRDRPGVKPLYYYYKNDLLLFGSELKVLMAHPSFEKDICNDAIASFMQFGYVPAPSSIFKDTFKLNAGHYLEFDLVSRELNTVQYWNVYDHYNQPALDISLPDAVSETEKILTKAFQYRMVSDVPVGVFLSGGYDSSCVTALLQANNNEKIKTFTIGVPDAGLNEAPYAKDIAERLGTDHTEYYCTEKEALEIVPELSFYFDEPFADSSAIPTTLVSRIAREKVTVALSADGGDEIFAGYNRYDYMMKYGGRIRNIPPVLRKAVAAVMDAIPADKVPVLNKKYLFHSRYEKLKNLFRNPSEQNVLLSLSRAMDDVDIDALFLSPVKKLSTHFDSEELLEKYHSELAYMMAIDYETYLVDDILQKVDRAAMTVSLEGREPFLDQAIIEWAARLPMDYKYNNGEKKFIIKQIVHKYLPKEMMDRPKMGFGIPVATWLRNELRPFVEKYFDATFIERQGIFSNMEIQRIRKDFFGGKIERAEKIWYLLMFQMWYDRWMNGQS